MSLLADCLMLARHDLRLFLRGAQPKKPDAKLKNKRANKGKTSTDSPSQAPVPATNGAPPRRIWLWVLLAVLWAPFAFFAALGLSKIPAQLPNVAHLWISVGVIGLLGVTLLSALTIVADVLFLRRDGELLAMAPIDPRAPAIVRMVTVGISAGIIFILFTLSITLFLPFVGGWRWLGLVPQAIAIALLAAAVAMALARVLFALFGARRVRSTVYALASLMGLATFVVMQSNNLIKRPGTDIGWAEALAAEWSDGIGADAPILWISKVLTGPFWMWGGAVLVVFALYALTAATFGRKLMRSALNPRVERNRKKGTGRVREFPGGPMASVMRKEWRIISRDAQLGLLLIQQSVYLSPVLIAFAANSENSPTRIAAIAGAAVVFAASSISGRAVWLIAGGESAPELLKLAPAREATIRWGKILAILRLAALFSLLAAIGTLALGAGPWAALTVLAFGALASCGAARIAFRFVRPVEVKGFRRPPKGSFSGSLGQGLFTSLLSASAALCASGRPLLSLAPLLAAIAAFYVFTVEDDKPRPALA